jgi:hypothetical protein
MPHPSILGAYCHEQVRTAPSRQCVGVCTQLTHFVDGTWGRRHDEKYQSTKRMYSVIGTHHPIRFEQQGSSCRRGAQQGSGNHEISKTPQTCALANKSM